MGQALSSFEPSAVRHYRHFESLDVDETRERISTVMQPHDLTPAKRAFGFRSEMNFVRLSGLGLGTIRFGEMHVNVPVMDDYFLFLCCLDGHAKITVDAHEVSIDSTRGAICGPGRHFEGSFSADCEQFVFRVDRDLIHAHTGIRDLVINPNVDLNRPELAPWTRQLQLLISSPELLSLAQRDPRIAIEFEHLLISLLMAGQPHLDSSATLARSIVPGSVRRAETYIREHALEPMRLQDIADAAGLPARTLLENFKRFREISPMRYLRDVRLDHARAQLLACNEQNKVVNIALECGFGHLSRFARDYMSRFGERPSDTLKRRKPSSYRAPRRS
jgi:AraC-like DNA-binding protein